MMSITQRVLGASALALSFACAASPRSGVARASRAAETRPSRSGPGEAGPGEPRAGEPGAGTQLPVVRAILEESLAHGQAYAKLEALCSQAPKRLSGSLDAKKAVEWARRQFESDGVDGVHLEPCTVPVWVRGTTARLDVVEPSSATATLLPIAALGGSIAADGLTAEVVEVRTFEELAQLGDGARGKIVFFDRPMDPKVLDPFRAYGGAVDQRGQGAIQAAKAGGVAAIVRSMTLLVDDLPHTGAMHYQAGVEKVPTAAISTAGADRLHALLLREKHLKLRLALDCATLPDAESNNVVAEIRGREKPGEIVLIGGHLDAWDLGQGAHDDGAGVVQVVEALRLLKKLDLHPRRTIRAVLFMNEENGQRGAAAYHAAHATELAQHVMALESDRGGFAPRGFGTDANPAAFGALASVVELFAGTGADRLVAGGGGTDIEPLAQDGVVLMELLPDAARYFDVHHCARDTVSEVHPRELELGAGLVAALAWCVADDEAPLARNAGK